MVGVVVVAVVATVCFLIYKLKAHKLGRRDGMPESAQRGEGDNSFVPAARRNGETIVGGRLNGNKHEQY